MRYLLFDADETIWDFKKTEEIGFSVIFNHFGLENNQETIDKYMKGNLQCWQDYENGLISLEELETLRWELFFKRIDKNYSAKEAATIFGNTLANNGLFLDGAKEFLENISLYRKSLVTNGISHIQRQRAKDTHLKRYFENIFISEEIGFRKPQKELFDYVLNKIGKSKEECLMIGDSEKSDILGANRAGIDSIYLSFKGEKSNIATYSVSSYEKLEELIRRI